METSGDSVDSHDAGTPEVETITPANESSAGAKLAAALPATADGIPGSLAMPDSVETMVRAAVRDEMRVFDARMRRIELMLESLALHKAPVEIGEPPEGSNGSEARP